MCYSKQSKGYKTCDINASKLIVSKYVAFQEHSETPAVLEDVNIDDNSSTVTVSGEKLKTENERHHWITGRKPIQEEESIELRTRTKNTTELPEENPVEEK